MTFLYVELSQITTIWSGEIKLSLKPCHELQSDAIICYILPQSKTVEVSWVKFGHQSIDSHLEPGIPAGSVIGIHGNPGLPKLDVGIKFALVHQEEQLPLIVTTKSTYSQLQEITEMYKLTLQDALVLDAAHWRIKRLNQKLTTDAQYEVSNLSDLNALLAKIMQACKEHNVRRLLFDSPSSLFLYSTPGTEQIYRFFELLNAFTRSSEITLCYTMEYLVHPQQVISTMQYLSDGIIELSTNDRQIWAEIKFLNLTSIRNEKFTIQM